MPASTLRGCSVVLAHEDSFIARYVESGLRAAGADVIGPAFCAEELIPLLGARSISACVISATYALAACACLSTRRELHPAFVLIGHGGLDTAFPMSALCYPFATYQISDAVGDLLRSMPVAAAAQDAVQAKPVE